MCICLCMHMYVFVHLSSMLVHTNVPLYSYDFILLADVCTKEVAHA